MPSCMYVGRITRYIYVNPSKTGAIINSNACPQFAIVWKTKAIHYTTLLVIYDINFTRDIKISILIESRSIFCWNVEFGGVLRDNWRC